MIIPDDNEPQEKKEGEEGRKGDEKVLDPSAPKEGRIVERDY